MNQKMNKEDFKVISLLVDVLKPESDSYMINLKASKHIGIIRQCKSDHSHIAIMMREFGFEYPIQYIKLALYTKKRYKKRKKK
jgi:hypothetical protein